MNDTERLMPTPLGRLIKAARLEQGLSLNQLAQIAGVTKSYLSKIERGMTHYPPKPKVLTALARALDLDPIQICYAAGRISPEDEALIVRLAQQYGPRLTALLQALVEGGVA
jgi:transcriptional regulator with XRE-family HTH domain